MTAPLVTLARHGLTPADIVRIARGGAKIEIADGVTDRLAALAGAGADNEHADRQRRILRAHAAGMGPPLPLEVVRAMMAARAAGLAAGGSGASPAVLEALVAAVNAGLTPRVPGLGSIGAGDLAPLAHMALSLIGEGGGEVGGVMLIGASALEAAGLVPLALGPRDGIVLIGANALTVGQGALALADAEGALDALDAAAALSLEGFRGKFRVGFGCALFILLQAVGQFESS